MSEPGATAGPRWQTQCGIGVALLLVAAALWFDAGAAAARRRPWASGRPPACGWSARSSPSSGLAHLRHRLARARRPAACSADDRGNHASLGMVLAALVGQIVAAASSAAVSSSARSGCSR